MKDYASNCVAGSFLKFGWKWLLRNCYNLTRFSRNALVTTDTELSAMAAPAMTGDSSKPKAG